jgi:D-tyrosyl-tRNA(Tyr) deacylase
VSKGDSEADSRYMIEKVVALRIFAESQGKMNLSLKEV